MTASTSATYDDMPYGSAAFPHSHPHRLAAVGKLFGMHPPDPRSARVLELGCASGGNLIPMAQHMPDAGFVGVDLSSKQIEEGSLIIQAAGLKNIKLQCRNLLDLTAELGTFDYIICHGIFSWVPPAVQDKTLEVCRDLLAPHGIAYLSYNVYPGWHMRQILRDMVLFHCRRYADAHVKLREARSTLAFLAQSTARQDSAYARYLREQLDQLEKVPDWYFFHEYLEHVNAPCYFHELASRAQEKRLQYLGEAELQAMAAAKLNPELEATLAKHGMDLLDLEQLQDFIDNRSFRQTLLCHQAVTLERHLCAESLSGMMVSSRLEPIGRAIDDAGHEVEQFRFQDGSLLSAGEPLIKSALAVLHRAGPQAVEFEELLVQARREAYPGSTLNPVVKEQQRQSLAELVFRCTLWSSFMELHAVPPLEYLLQPGPAPRATAVARFQAEMGGQATNVRHQTIGLNEASRHILCGLDGSRDRHALVEIMESLVARGAINVHQDGQPLPSGKKRKQVLEQALDHVLCGLAKEAFLVG